MISPLVRKNILLIIAACCLCFAVTPTKSEVLEQQANNDFIVFFENDKTIHVYDLKKNKAFSRSFDLSLRQLEICPNYPYASFVGQSLDKKGAGKKYFIYDLEQDKIYNDNLYIDVPEKRWSLTGEYAYLNNLTSFNLIPTKRLRDYLISADFRKKTVEIKGHPLGQIWQVSWIGDKILYASGIDEAECWGFYDTQNQKNYLISCCGMQNNAINVDQCSRKLKESSNIMALFTIKSEKNEILPISNDFFEEIRKLNKN